MKILAVSLLAAAGLWGQGAGAGVIESQSVAFNPVSLYTDAKEWDVYDFLQYKITRQPNGVKTLTFLAYRCIGASTPIYSIAARLMPTPSPQTGLDSEDVCTPVSQAQALTFSPVQDVIGEFLNDASDAPHKIVYGSPLAYRPRAVAPSATSSDPYMICLDGFGNTVIKFDLATGSTVAQVTVPNEASGPLAIRPTAAPPSNEVWIAGGSTQTAQITVADLGAQTLLGNIPIPNVPSSATAAGIGFSNDGSTAYEALKLPAADASGNLGAVAVFDATKRTLTSTLFMKFAPTAFVMSPDGLTAYLLDGSGRITYYDTLSGTADFTTSTYTPGKSGGYGGSGPVFIHPDGTRLFWSVGTLISSFDLTVHKVTAQYATGLPTTSAASIQMSSDGKLITMGNGNGAWVTVETVYGNILSSGQDAGATQTFSGPAR